MLKKFERTRTGFEWTAFGWIAFGWLFLATFSAAAEETETKCLLTAIPCTAFRAEELAPISNKARNALNEAWQNHTSVRGTKRAILFDASQHSTNPRFFVIERDTRKIHSYLAAHGRGSDPDHDGWLDHFSNEEGSKATPRGAFTTAETYFGRHGYSLKLDGLEKENANARDRAIVIHGADYVRPGRNPIGRSWGCPALNPDVARQVIDDIKGGALLVIYG